MYSVPGHVIIKSCLPIPGSGSIARGDQRLNCSMRGSITGIGERQVLYPVVYPAARGRFFKIAPACAYACACASSCSRSIRRPAARNERVCAPRAACECTKECASWSGAVRCAWPPRGGARDHVRMPHPRSKTKTELGICFLHLYVPGTMYSGYMVPGGSTRATRRIC